MMGFLEEGPQFTLDGQRQQMDKRQERKSDMGGGTWMFSNRVSRN